MVKDESRFASGTISNILSLNSVPKQPWNKETIHPDVRLNGAGPSTDLSLGWHTLFASSTTPLLADGMVAFGVYPAQLIAVPLATNSLPTNTLTLDVMTFFVLPGSPDSDTYNPNTAIQFYRLCRELIPTGILRLEVASTSLNISSNASAPSDDTSGYTIETEEVRPSIPSVDSPDSPLASSTSTPSSNVPTSMASVPDPNARIGPMRYSQLLQQYPQYMLPPTGAYVPPFHPPQGLYTMPGYSTFQPGYTPYNSRAEYTLPASIDFRAPASTLHPDSADISSVSVALPSTVPVPDNSAFNRSAANPYSYPMTQVPPVANSSTIQSNPQPATPSGSTSGGSSATVSTPSTIQGPNLRPRK
ncbi:hypothetical protein B0H13DRAFT_2399339 [Mycena leptocephala]|nr:hypothetical protein B0H13DRAFT_2399339 [Mycena leptocephala]